MADLIITVLVLGTLTLLVASLLIARHDDRKAKQDTQAKEATENAQKKKNEIRTGDHNHDLNTMADIVHEYSTK